MYRLPASPAEHEHTDRDKKRSDNGGWKAILWSNVSLIIELLLLDKVQPQAIWYHDDNGAHHDAQKCKSVLSEVEMVNVVENDRKGFEPREEEGVYESQIGICDDKNGLREAKLEWSIETGRGHILELHVLGSQICLALEIRVARQLSKSLCPLVQDSVGACLGQSEDEYDQTETGKPDELPNGPFPGLVLCGKASDERAKDRSTDGGDTPDTDCIRNFVSRPHVRQGCAACRKDRGTNESLSFVNKNPVATFVKALTVRKRNTRRVAMFGA